MATKKPRIRSKEVGFIGANLAKGGDMTIYKRLIKEVEADPEMNQSKIIRLALKEYFEKRDKK